MKTLLRQVLTLLLCFGLCLCFASVARAAEPETQAYADTVIVGFENPDSPIVIDTPYKYALIELEKEFPAQLTVLMGGTVFYERGDGDSVRIDHVEPALTMHMDAEWKCLENYDEDLDVFHFVPVLDGETLASGLELPVITVNVLGRIQIPPHPMIPADAFGSVHVFSPSSVPRGTLPASYNGYTKGVLPPVRNQGEYGTCWAFASIAAVEADLIHDGNASTGIDLSELHLAYFTYHDFYDEKGCNIGDSVALNGMNYLYAGGSPFNAALTLSNMLGPVLESDVPYSRAGTYAPSPLNGRTGRYQITNTYIYDVNDRDSVKRAIMDHGAVAGAYNSNYYYYSATNNSFYYYDTSPGTDHIIAIVGWDDNFSKSKFSGATPAGNGAWLIRNSWGVNGYNYAGYFWMSYYDRSLAPIVFGYDTQLSRYDHCYAYDNAYSMRYWTIRNGGMVSQKFRIDKGEAIQAVGVYCENASANLALTISCGTASTTASLYVGDPGYYLVELSEPLPIIENAEVTVSYVITGNDLYITGETSGSYSGYTGNSSFRIDFNSACGSGMFINGEYKGVDAYIKLFTNDYSVSEPDFVLPAKLKTIEKEAFSGGAFTYVKLPDNAVSIGSRAFANCPNLAYVYIPQAIKTISADAFSGLSRLTILGTEGSYAETYAQQNGITFMPVLAG